MSNMRGSGDDGSAVPVGLAIAEPTVPLSEDTTWEVMSDANSTLGEAAENRGDEDDVLVRDARAAAAAGDRRRADTLECARALGLERHGRTDEALGAWRNVFEHDPSMLIAYWGLRRSLEGRGAWEELLGVFERRISAMAPAEAARDDPGPGLSSAAGDTRESGRADLWLGHGRVLEDRLGRDEAAARSYRTGLIEFPGHVGLLLSLALLGWRRADDGMIAEAMAGFLRSPLPPAARAAMTAAVARIERSAAGSEGASDGRARVIDAVSAARALETLRGALGAVGPAEAVPLVSELWTLARATADPLARVEILQELVSHLPPERGDVIVGLLRERARLLRDQLGDKAASAETLRRALTVSPRNPMVLTELADLIEETCRDGGVDGLARVSEGLAALIAVVAPSGQPLRPGAERELALRYLVALGRQGRAADGLAFLDHHPEVQDGRPDVATIDVVLRTMTGDAVGLAAAFEGVDISHPEGAVAGADGPRSAGDALIIAGVLRERAAPDARGDALSLASYRKAVALDPASEVAAEALERRLRASESWEALAEHWQGRLGDAGASVSTDGRTTDDPARFRLLEELVALERDDLADPVAARRFQDELCRRADHPRANLRRLDVELLTGAGVSAGPTASMCDSLRALGEQAGTSDAQAAFHVEAGLALAARGERGESEELLRAALSTDTTGRAASGLERLLANKPPGSAASLRAEIVRTELVRRGTDDAAVARALRFRLAHHLASAGRDAEALEVLDELRAAGDEMAGAFGWEIARQSQSPDLARAFLEGSEGSGASHAAARSRDLRVDSDLGEILEAAEDLRAAATAYREALRRQPSADAALGLLRIGARLGDSAVLGEATRALAPFADDETRVQAWRDLEMLDILARPHEPHGRGFEPKASAAKTAEDESTAVLAWATAMERGDVVSTSAALLALARVTSRSSDGQQRSGLLARAAARSRLGGAALAGAVHDQVHALSDGGAEIALGLSDLPVAGRPERAAARVARAARSGARLAYALEIERAVDAEMRGDSATALEAYRLATERDPSGIEGLDGIRRVCLATGNRLGAAHAGMRLGSVLKTPRRAAEELRRAAALWREEGLRGEAKRAAWQALALEPGSEALFELLRSVLAEDADHVGLDRLFGLRLAVVEDPKARVPLWFDRALNRLERLGHRDLAIQDFKRILKVASDHQGALRILATLATSSQAFAPAIGYLLRLRDLESDGVGWRDLTLELADAHEATGEGAQARAALEEAVLRRPDDELPRQRLVDLLLRAGDWRAARGALETWSEALPAKRAAALWLRIGEIEGDQGRSRAAAVAAYSRAVVLDPLGDGLLALAALHARLGDMAARQSVLDDGIAEARRVLARAPCDVARLRHLRALYVARAADAPADAPADDASAELAKQGVSVVDEILDLLRASESGATVGWPAAPIPVLRGALPAALPDHLSAAGARGFAAEVWGKISRVATEMFDAAKVKPPARERVSAATEPRLAWIEAAAAAMGLPALELLLSKRPEAADDVVVAIDAGEPALAVGRAALVGDAAIRFKVGRALSLLRDRAVMFEERSPAEMATLFAAAATAAGAGTAGSAGTPHGVDGPADVPAYGKNMLRLMSRRERKSLELEASRFGFEPIDGAGFQAAVLETADRMGLLLAGDVATSVRVACGGTAASPAAVAADGRALALLGYALGEAYLTLRRELAEGVD